MNYIWVLLWLLLSVFIVGAFLWSVRVLLQQKKAWHAYAKKYRLPYNRGRFFSSPSIVGDFKGHRINIYSEEQQADDARGTRFRSVVELMRRGDVDGSGAIASNHLVPILNLFDLHDVFSVESELWSPSYSGRTNDLGLMRTYITPERFAVLNKLFRLPKGAFLIIFNPEDILFRFETSDPLHDPRKIDKLVNAMLEISETLRGAGTTKEPASEDRAVTEEKGTAEEDPVAGITGDEQQPETPPQEDVPVAAAEDVDVAARKKAQPKKKAATKKKAAAPKTKGAL